MPEKAKIVDKTAPRFRKTKFRHNVLNRDFHEKYLQVYPDGVKDYSIFKSIIGDFNTMLHESVVSNRDGVKLPAYMGIMALCSFKPKKKVPLNWNKLGQYGLKIKERNIQTNELVCKIVYSLYTSRYKFQNSHIWRFEACREFKNKASAGFLKNYNIYKRMDNKTQVSKLFRDEYIRTNFQRSRDEQRVDSGQQDNG